MPDADGVMPRLTRTVSKGGCASKLAAGSLSALLAALPRQQHPDLLVGSDLLDDAAVWRISEDRAMVQTVDFFTPILDDPRDFGAVAAANALSDIYAMGGEPATALTVLAFPSATLSDTVLGELMEGAMERIAASGALLVGGHSIDDETLKFGFTVTGFVDPEQMWTNRGAHPGDALVLTKAVGTGTLTGALKNDEIEAAEMVEAIASMKQLNRLPLGGALRRAVHAATDVTGFGLLGHALHLARGSGVSLAIDVGAVPLLAGAGRTLAAGIVTRAHGSNSHYVEGLVAGRRLLGDVDWLKLVDPQTSGGLLLSVAPESLDDVMAALAGEFPRASVVGEVTRRKGSPLLLR